MRQMVKGGYGRIDEKNDNYNFKISTERLLEICGAKNLSEYIVERQKKYAAHLIRTPNTNHNKRLIFNSDYNTRRGHKIPNLIEEATKTEITSLFKMERKKVEKKGKRDDESQFETDIDQFCTMARKREI